MTSPVSTSSFKTSHLTVLGTVTTVNTIIWGAIEPCTSVVAACLPLLGPVLLKRRPKPAENNVVSSFFRKTRSTPSKPTAQHVSLSSESTRIFALTTVVSDNISSNSATGVSSTSANV